VRSILIGRMAKPEEVLIVEEEGEVVREVTKDVDAIILYKTMRCALFAC
jgi:exportin-1